MTKHLLDHDRKRDDGRTAQAFARIERAMAHELSDPKVRSMTRAAHGDEHKAEQSRLREFLKIERQGADS